jgi:hypothetical protein
MLFHLAVSGTLKINTLESSSERINKSVRTIVKSDAHDSNYIFRLGQTKAKSIVRRCGETFSLLECVSTGVPDVYGEAHH